MSGKPAHGMAVWLVLLAAAGTIALTRRQARGLFQRRAGV